jgi:dipeptidyl aminopeptidase/acylaminoacyl peptidase
MIRRYGTWPSPIAAADVAAQGRRFSSVSIHGDDIYWIEGRPIEGGRNVLVRRRSDGSIVDIVPPGFNVRTRVHEYGGAPYTIAGGDVYFSNFADQRIYRVSVDGGSAPRNPPYTTDLGSAPRNPPDTTDLGSAPRNPPDTTDLGSAARNPPYGPPGAVTPRDLADGSPVAITPPGDWFYADAIIDARRGRLICVREDHTAPGEPVNTLVSIPLAGSVSRDGASDVGEQTSGTAAGSVGQHAGEIIASGYDFYSDPRLSPDGSRLSWLAWRHPQMPWDGTELWVADVSDAGTLSSAHCVAGGAAESIYQPGWWPDGALCFASDRDGWWRLYRFDRSGRCSPVVVDPPELAEFGRPQWVFGTATWAFVGLSRMVAAYAQHGRWRLCIIDVESGAWRDVGADLEPRDWLAAGHGHVLMVAASATTTDAIVRIDIESGAADILRQSSNLTLDARNVSVPEPITFSTSNGDAAHAFYYAPRNRECSAPSAGRPPLIAISHGGPTTAANATLDLKIQFWTTRGFAVVDVNYGGSSGYGRAYRERLNGQWGIVDVDDMISAARYLVAQGKADPGRLIIRGGSSGGYTTLCALTFRPGAFTAGASYYGICDLEVLEQDTHKFEARYSHRLIGPYPAMRETYRARSPIHFVDRLACPVILLQGLEDKVVPPNQSEMMAAAARANGLPVAYLTFEGEQHGFRKAESIIRSLEAELYFYGAVFGFTPADAIEPVPIDNLPERSAGPSGTAIPS